MVYYKQKAEITPLDPSHWPGPPTQKASLISPTIVEHQLRI